MTLREFCDHNEFGYRLEGGGIILTGDWLTDWRDIDRKIRPLDADCEITEIADTPLNRGADGDAFFDDSDRLYAFYLPDEYGDRPMRMIVSAGSGGNGTVWEYEDLPQPEDGDGAALGWPGPSNLP
jgi:hypothetical protein